MKNSKRNGIVFLGKVVIVCGVIFGITSMAYKSGYYDAIEQNIGASECKPLRKITKISDFRR